MSEFKDLDTYKALREKWVHEDNVVNHRLTWLIVSQAMLMAAYGWSVANNIPKTQKLIWLIPSFGMIFTLALGASVIASIIAQNRLSNLEETKNWPVAFCIDTYTPTNWVGRLAAISLPFFMFIVWLVVLVA